VLEVLIRRDDHLELPFCLSEQIAILQSTPVPLLRRTNGMVGAGTAARDAAYMRRAGLSRRCPEREFLGVFEQGYGLRAPNQRRACRLESPAVKYFRAGRSSYVGALDTKGLQITD